MTAREITIALYWKLHASSDVMLPRYTPFNWWECDMWRLTKNGYVDEYEIKTSVSDFKADAKKTADRRERFDRETKQWITVSARNKHNLLATTIEGPNRFWFVIDERIHNLVEIPDYAGLIVARKHGHYLHVEKAAPVRHRIKWSGDRMDVLKTFYYRFWTHECRQPRAFNELLAI